MREGLSFPLLNGLPSSKRWVQPWAHQHAPLAEPGQVHGRLVAHGYIYAIHLLKSKPHPLATKEAACDPDHNLLVDDSLASEWSARCES